MPHRIRNIAPSPRSPAIDKCIAEGCQNLGHLLPTPQLLQIRCTGLIAPNCGDRPSQITASQHGLADGDFRLVGGATVWDSVSAVV